MTSTKSVYKSNFLSVIQKTFKQRLINIILILVISVLAPIFAISINVFKQIMDATYSPAKTDVTFFAVGVLCFMVAACGFFSLSLAPKMFSEIYKKRSCDTFFSLPIIRKDYFFGKYVLGLIVNIVAFAISGIIFTGAMPLLSNQHVIYTINFAELTKIAIPLLLALLAIYTAFIMCAVTAGKRLHYIFLALICLLFTQNCVTGVVAALNSVWGCYVDPYLACVISPVQNAISSVVSEKHLVVLSIVSIIEIIGMMLVGYLAFKKRKAESAEGNVSGKFVPTVLLIVLTLAGFMNYAGIGSWVSAVLLGIVVAGLFGMAFSGIFYKSVYTKHTGIVTISVCLVATIFLSAVYIPNHSFYVKKVPTADQVESVEIKQVSTGEIGVGILGIVTSSLSEYEEYQGFTITTPEGINDVIRLHEKLVDDKTIEKSSGYNAISLLGLFLGTDTYDYASYCDYQLVYTLKNGKTLTRTYAVDSAMIQKEFEEVLKNEEVLRQLPPFCYDEENVLYVSAESCYYDNEEYYDDVDPEPVYDEFGNIVDYVPNYDTSYNYGIEQTIYLDYNEFSDAYISDLLKLDGSKFYNSLPYFGFPFYDYGYNSSDYYNPDEYETTMEIDVTVYYINPEVSDDIKAKLRSMSVEELNEILYGDSFDVELWGAVDSDVLTINSYHTDTSKYLESKGLNINY